jgi:hypothetical protein
MKIHLVFFFMFSIFFQSCKQVETLSPRNDFYLSFANSKKTDKIEIDVIKGNSSYIITEGDYTIYKISLSEVRGGHSELLGTKFNIHDGLDAKRIKIKINDIQNRELSYNDVLLLNAHKLDSLLAYNVIL